MYQDLPLNTQMKASRLPLLEKFLLQYSQFDILVLTSQAPISPFKLVKCILIHIVYLDLPS